VSLTRADGLAIVGQLGTGVTAQLIADPNIRGRSGSGGQGAVVCAGPPCRWIVGLSLRLHRKAQPLNGAVDQSGPDARSISAG
jgi:hypothetical protein